MSSPSSTSRVRGSLRCVSVGYQGRSIESFCDALEEHAVEVLIDVRERAWSHRPEYRKTALARALSERGIAYIHCREAGNPYRPKKGRSLGLEQCIRLYGKYLDDNPDVVARVAESLAQAPSALFCYEAEQMHCHRSVLLERVSRIARVDIIEL